jgi:hypothetical protein
MKKLFTSIGFLIFISSVVFSQNIKLGIRASYDYPIWYWNFTPKEFSESKMGYSLGAYVNFRINDYSAFRTGLNFSSYEFSLSDETGFFASYLEIPAIYRRDIIKGKPLKFFIGLGVGINMVEGAYYSLYDPALSELPVLSHYKDEYFNNTRIYFPVGLSWEFPFGLGIEVGYNWNINDMGSDENIQFVSGVDSFNFGLEYTFNKKGK